MIPRLGLSCCLLLLDVLFSAGSVTSFAGDVTIRLINVKDGQPLAGQVIRLSIGDAPYVEATTSSEGTAVFYLHERVPKEMFLNADNGRIRPCYSWGAFSSKEAIEHGVIAENKCDPKGKLKGKFTAKPAEVIVFVRFLRWWERMQM